MANCVTHLTVTKTGAGPWVCSVCGMSGVWPHTGVTGALPGPTGVTPAKHVATVYSVAAGKVTVTVTAS
jgi:hypothetical protein